MLSGRILVDADSVNMLVKNTKALLEASREVGLEVNAERTKYIVVLPPECRTANKSIENVTDHNCLHKEIKSKLCFG